MRFQWGSCLQSLNSEPGSGVWNIPCGVKTIESGAFAYCFGLELLNLNAAVETIGDDVISSPLPYGAFEQCRSLLRVTAPENCKLELIGERSFRACCCLLNVPYFRRVHTISRVAFSKCLLLEKFYLPPKLKTIRERTFSNCHGLEAVDFGPSITVIGFAAFSECKSLQQLNLIDTKLVTIGSKAFESCWKLQSLSLPPTTEVSIRYKAFNDCKALASVVLSGLTRHVDPDAFKNCVSLDLFILNRLSSCTSIMSINNWAPDCDNRVKIIAPETTSRWLGVTYNPTRSAVLLRYYWSLKAHRKGHFPLASSYIQQTILCSNWAASNYQMSRIPLELFSIIFKFFEFTDFWAGAPF